MTSLTNQEKEVVQSLYNEYVQLQQELLSSTTQAGRESAIERLADFMPSLLREGYDSRIIQGLNDKLDGKSDSQNPPGAGASGGRKQRKTRKPKNKKRKLTRRR